MALASVTGGIALANSGLGIVHGFAGPLGSVTGAAHGAICAALLAHGLQSHQLYVQDPDLVSRIQNIQQWIADALGGDSRDAFNTLDTWVKAHGNSRATIARTHANANSRCRTRVSVILINESQPG